MSNRETGVSAFSGELMRIPTLAQTLGMSVAAVRLWAGRERNPLTPTQTTEDGAQLFTLEDAAAFIGANPQLSSAVKVRRRLAELAVPASAAGPSNVAPPASSGPSSQTAGHSGTRVLGEEELATVARDARTALDAAMRAVTRQARLAEQTAKAHAEVLEEIRTSIAALDGSLSLMTGPIGAPPS